MSYPNLNNVPQLWKNKTKDDQLTRLQLKTEEND